MKALLFLCFFLSGASSLVLELVWTRQLGLVFGSTTLAICTVLSAFMGGLALGSWLAGRLADRWSSASNRHRHYAMLGYAIAEGGIGLYALLVPLLLRGYPALNTQVWHLVGDNYALLTLFRFVATAALLLLPTTLMGATLPLLSRHLIQLREDLGRIGANVGGLYAANTFGAVAGTALAGFALLPEIGVRATNATAAVADIGLAVVVLLLRRRTLRRPEQWFSVETTPTSQGAAVAPTAAETTASDAATAAPPESIPLVPPSAITPTTRRLVLAAFAVSGATAMTYQVLWTRALAIVIGSSIYSFTLILLAFLVGLAGGAAIMSRLSAHAERPLAWLAATHFATVLMVGLSLLLIDKLPAAFLAFLRPTPGQVGSASVDDIMFYQFVLAALPVLPATFVMGGVLPLTIRVLSAGLGRVARDVGGAYSMNTLGAIVGSFAAGFVVLPLLGLDRGLRVAILFSAATSALVLLVCEAAVSRRVVAAVACLGFAGVATIQAPRWDLEHFQAGLFRISLAREILESGRWATPELVYYHDGTSTTVSVERWGQHLAMKNNGKVDASNGDDMPTQIMVGLMPLLFHPTALERPPTVAVVGYGSGVTVGAATQFPIAHLDAVELEPAVYAAARLFDLVNHRPHLNPKVRLIEGDGRNFLAQTPAEGGLYDVIISEPSNPWITGVSNLFTRDYWIEAKARLADDGVFCQWAQLYELSPANVKTILRTFSEVFPYTYVFAAEDLSSDLILVAANHPLSLDLARLARNFHLPQLAAELKRADVLAPEDILAYLLLTPEEIAAFTMGSPINTDDNALIEFAAPRDLLGYLRYDTYLARVYGATWPYGHLEAHLQGLGTGRERGLAEARIAETLIAHGKLGPSLRFSLAAERDGAADEGARTARLARLLMPRAKDDPDEPLAGDEDPLDPPRLPTGLSEGQTADFLRVYLEAEKEIRARRFAHAYKLLDAWPARYLTEGGKDLQLLAGFLEYKLEMEGEAVDRLKPLAADEGFVRRRPATLYYLARAYYDQVLYRAAFREMKRFVAATSTRQAGVATP